MKNQLLQQVIGVPIKTTTYGVERTSRLCLPDAAGQYHISSQVSTKSKGNFVLKRMNLLGKKADTFAHGVREHVRLGPKISETVKGKLSLGARILQVGGLEKIFKQLFSFREGEKLLKACQCYLSTTAGPIAGLLFISSKKVAFCSDRSIKIRCGNGEFLRVHYKVLIPLEKIKWVNQSENMKKPSQKYMESVTVDGFDIWFMGFLNYQKAFKYLQQAIPQNVEVTFREGEKLLKACQCYLSTTAGPIAGLLFISSKKVAFCSDRSIKIRCGNGEFLRVHYKVLIPLKKIKWVNQSENMKKPSQKYMESVTVDGFDIWFMGFLNYQKAFKYLQQAIPQNVEVTF